MYLDLNFDYEMQFVYNLKIEFMVECFIFFKSLSSLFILNHQPFILRNVSILDFGQQKLLFDSLLAIPLYAQNSHTTDLNCFFLTFISIQVLGDIW